MNIFILQYYTLYMRSVTDYSSDSRVSAVPFCLHRPVCRSYPVPLPTMNTLSHPFWGDGRELHWPVDKSEDAM